MPELNVISLADARKRLPPRFKLNRFDFDMIVGSSLYAASDLDKFMESDIFNMILERMLLKKAKYRDVGTKQRQNILNSCLRVITLKMISQYQEQTDGVDDDISSLMNIVDKV